MLLTIVSACHDIALLSLFSVSVAIVLLCIRCKASSYQSKISGCILVLCVCLLCILSFSVHNKMLQDMNQWVFNTLQNLIIQNSMIVEGLYRIAYLGHFKIWLIWISCIFCYLLKKKKAMLPAFILTLSCFFLMITGLKFGLNIARPLQGFQSFPSNHVAIIGLLSFMTLDLCCNTHSRSVWILTRSIAIFFVFVVAISRIYFKYHWFTDVFGALILIVAHYCIWNIIRQHPLGQLQRGS